MNFDTFPQVFRFINLLSPSSASPLSLPAKTNSSVNSKRDLTTSPTMLRHWTRSSDLNNQQTDRLTDRLTDRPTDRPSNRPTNRRDGHVSPKAIRDSGEIQSLPSPYSCLQSKYRRRVHAGARFFFLFYQIPIQRSSNAEIDTVRLYA